MFYNHCCYMYLTCEPVCDVILLYNTNLPCEPLHALFVYVVKWIVSSAVTYIYVCFSSVHSTNELQDLKWCLIFIVSEPSELKVSNVNHGNSEFNCLTKIYFIFCVLKNNLTALLSLYYNWLFVRSSIKILLFC